MNVDLFGAEINAWQPRESMTVSQWADQYRILDPLTTAEPGPWRTERTPYLRGILDSYSDPEVRQLTIMASTQVAKTEAQLNCLAYTIDQMPGPTMFVMPREKDAIRLAQRRIKPMIESSPRLARYTSDWATDNKLGEMKLGQTLLIMAWANSPAALASTPIRALFMDEVDKYPAFSGKEADPLSLAEERQRTFWDSKKVITSTPTTQQGYIHREYAVSDRRRYWVPCPKCGTFQILVFTSVRFPKDVRDPAIIKRDRLAVYVCRHCEAELDELDKFSMTAAGVWCPEGCKVDSSGDVKGKYVQNENHGFHLSALYSPWLTWSEIAAKFVQAHENPARLLNFVNSWLGEIWEETGDELSPEYVATRSAPHARGNVPAESVVLTAGIDVQGDHFYYTIRAWAPGETSWLVQADRVDTWEILTNVIFRGDFPIAGATGGDRARVRLACIDSAHRTEEVYRFSQKWSDTARAVRGQRTIAGGIPITSSRVERTYSGRVPKTGLKLWNVDTTYFKDKLARLIRVPLEQVGAWRIHDATPEAYCRQIASEHKVIELNKKTGRKSSVWMPRPGFGGNHWLDCEVYALAAAEMLGVYHLPVEGRPEIDEEDDGLPKGPKRQLPRTEEEPRNSDRDFTQPPRPKPRRKGGWSTGRRGGGGWSK